MSTWKTAGQTPALNAFFVRITGPLPGGGQFLRIIVVSPELVDDHEAMQKIADTIELEEAGQWADS